MKYLLLLLTGFAGGWVNTIAGGGSAFMLPLLIFLGLPAEVANGTNRITIFIQNLFGVAGYKSRGYSDFPYSIYNGISALSGAIAGSSIAIRLPDAVFHKILAGVIVLVLVFLIFKPSYKTESHLRKTPLKIALEMLIFFFVGIYGGFIQAGTGFIILLILNRFNGYSLIKSNAAKTMIILIFSVGALATFALHGLVNWQYGALLATGAAFGGWFGSRWAVKKGDKIIRVFLAIVMLLMAVKLWVYD